MADPIHAWMDYEEFINEVREKLFPFIRERIEELNNKLDDNRTLYNKRMEPLNKRSDEIWAAYKVYSNEGLPRDIEKLKKLAIRPYLRDVIGGAIGVAIGLLIFFKLLFPMFSEFPWFIILTMVVGMLLIMVIFFGKPLVGFLKERHYSESRSKEFANELTNKWLEINGYHEANSNIYAEEDKYKNIKDDFESRIYSAECALDGNNEDLLNFYNIDNKTKNYYLEKIYEGAW